ncbi:hypothetical protein SAMN05660284_02034 [Formivibrio citricus]|uniref:Oxaloacetate decarboxylase, gamma chain n=1 Tax=Formivibrio citricus TaxID=83765 RepID=A0A1I5AYE7_9NEIS|nr:hypothetical protein [Formivibrio citricus]SFN67468.1 hypothetical protein SAMN05660284_02034 [Formivibrio citricus]
MNAIIPDTLAGALILSIIDFFLSFVIIAGIGVVLAFFPLLNRFASAEDKHGHKHSHGKKHVHGHGHSALPAAASVTPAGNAADQHVAAISAAVAVVVGPHKIVQIERAN